MNDTIGGLGEFGLLDRVLAGFPQTAGVIVGPGDDAAVLGAGDGRIVASTDMLVEGRHFRREWSSAEDVGHKAAAQNFADIAAMGARPTALLVALAAPADLPVAWMDGLMEGLRAECSRAGAAVVGGDTVRSSGGEITVAATALGDLDGRAPVLRSGARVGDVAAIAGMTGPAAAGLRLLAEGRSDTGPCVEAQRRPRPPYSAGALAASAGARAMIDISDGLLADAGHIAAASDVSIALESARLPGAESLRQAAEALRGAEGGSEVLRWQLTGGEDHALLAAFPPQRPLPAGWRQIGTVEQGTGLRVDGSRTPSIGWDHFSP